MNNLRACFRCGDWPDVSYELEGAHWCGPCAPWGRAPCPLGPLIAYGGRVLERLERDGLRAAHADASRLVAWLEGAVAAWPGPDPWRTVRLAMRAHGRLQWFEWWRPEAPGAEPRTLGPSPSTQAATQ